MDKYGHLYTSYFQGVLCYKGAKWTGLSEDKAILTGLACGALFQTTIEVFDGFSTQWGFSWSDFAMNTAGLGTFYFQQKYWGEQRISLKVSSFPQSYSDDPITSLSGMSTTTFNQRATDLYGTGFAERFLKDYNAQIIWASVNLASFMGEDTRIPQWFNLAVGYGANNMFGGFENRWNVGNEQFDLGPGEERYQQFYLGLDVDLTRIEVKNHFLRTVLNTVNIFKIPFPALEINTRGEVIFHFIAK
jgi:uncharacterized protein YfiM (DUF2279 family)